MFQGNDIEKKPMHNRIEHMTAIILHVHILGQDRMLWWMYPKVPVEEATFTTEFYSQQAIIITPGLAINSIFLFFYL